MDRYFYQNKKSKRIYYLQISETRAENIFIVFDINNSRVRKTKKKTGKQLIKVHSRIQEKRIDKQKGVRENNCLYRFLNPLKANIQIEAAGLTPHCPAVQTSFFMQEKLGV